MSPAQQPGDLPHLTTRIPGQQFGQDVLRRAALDEQRQAVVRQNGLGVVWVATAPPPDWTCATSLPTAGRAVRAATPSWPVRGHRAAIETVTVGTYPH
ncbi:hypothetical protein V6W11_25575 [Micromonospora profundi]